MKRLALLCMALVLALGLCGGGHTYFTDTATIEGTFSAGTLDVEFDNLSSNDPGGTDHPGKTPEMDVACTVVQPNEEAEGFIDMRVNDVATEYANYTCIVEIDGE